jgi:hypothetical protein
MLPDSMVRHTCRTQNEVPVIGEPGSDQGHSRQLPLGQKPARLINDHPFPIMPQTPSSDAYPVQRRTA